jgi:hypothetical protein
MPDEPAKPIDVGELAADLERRTEQERAAGAYADDLSQFQLDLPSSESLSNSSIVQGFDLGGPGPRVRFRPELGFSSKPIIGPGITLVKRFYLRLLFYVIDDLARQTDAAIRRVETALAVEIASRERLEWEVRRLEAKLAPLEHASSQEQESGRAD